MLASSSRRLFTEIGLMMGMDEAVYAKRPQGEGGLYDWWMETYLSDGF